MIRHKVQGFLFIGTGDIHAQIHVFKRDARRDMHMTVDDAGHNEFPAKISDFSFKVRKARLVAYVDKFAVFHNERGRHQVVPVRGEYFRVFDNLICSHLIFFPSIYTSFGS